MTHSELAEAVYDLVGRRGGAWMGRAERQYLLQLVATDRADLARVQGDREALVTWAERAEHHHRQRHDAMKRRG